MFLLWLGVFLECEEYFHEPFDCLMEMRSRRSLVVFLFVLFFDFPFFFFFSLLL